MIGRNWREIWTAIVPFLASAPEISKVICTTNAVESLNYTLRKATRNRQAFPSSEATMKLASLALQNISRGWTGPHCAPALYASEASGC